MPGRLGWGKILVAVMVLSWLDGGTMATPFHVDRVLELADVPAGFPVRFCLLTEGDRQYVAYYDHERRMTVASRTLDTDQWQYRVLPSRVDWDTHNYITLAVDADGHLHVSGNMHVDPLVYFRTEQAGDITTLKKAGMTGELEDRVTYPEFLTNEEGDLIFTYRHGSSGSGINIYNRYDCRRRSWSRLLDTPLFDGEEARNAYPVGPVRGPDGWFHVTWVWRDTPDCATNHHLSYARSRNLMHWESVFGKAIDLPITLAQKALWVDPIPSHGGIINGCQKLFFNVADRPVITYHKADEEGNMQIYAARPETGRWARHLLTDWDKPVVFGGGGSMGFIGISISGLTRVEPDLLTMTYRHQDYGRGRLVIDENTLHPVNKVVAVPAAYPEEMGVVQSEFPGMGIQRALDIGSSGQAAVRYVLQWETLGRNRDRPREPPLPAPSRLRLYKLTRQAIGVRL